MFLGTELFAFRGSAIAPATIHAYLDTHYCIHEPWGFVLSIGRRHHGLVSLMAGGGAGTSAVLTAWNPFSRRRSRKDNDRAQAALTAELDGRRLSHFHGFGADPERKWPAEDSRLVLGLDLSTAAALGQKFKQNGIVWAGSDGLPMLVLLR